MKRLMLAIVLAACGSAPAGMVSDPLLPVSVAPRAGDPCAVRSRCLGYESAWCNDALCADAEHLLVCLESEQGPLTWFELEVAGCSVSPQRQVRFSERVR